MYIFDEDSANTVKAEEQAYTLWAREQKNIILNMSNVQKKQTMWSRLFPQVERSDDYLSGTVF